MGSGLNERVHKVEEKEKERWKESPGKGAKPKIDCRNCEYKHTLEKEKFPAFDKECRLCRKDISLQNVTKTVLQRRKVLGRKQTIFQTTVLIQIMLWTL